MSTRLSRSLENGSGSRSQSQSPSSDEIPLLMKPKYIKYSAVLDNPKGYTIAWQDLSVYVPAGGSGIFHKKERHRPFTRVLNNVSGICQPRSLMAVMGASGAGKTTLMNILAYRAQGDVAINGEIRINGVPIGSYMSRISGYVYQEDLFVGSLTVREHLTFMARMKLDRRLSKYERIRRVEELLHELGLKKCENTTIGIPGVTKGISGGEKKRLAFATEVLTDPMILFCDEPTTGLDSYSAQKIVNMMKNLASKGKTIISTIHQPSSQVFSMFDQVCLLAEGRTAFLGNSADGLTFFKKMGWECPEHYNPADFYIRTLALLPGQEKESRKTIKAICDTFSMSQSALEMEDLILEQVAYNSSDYSNYSSLSSVNGWKNFDYFETETKMPFWWTQTYWLVWRSLLDSARNPKVHFMRTLQKIILAIMIGICFFGVTVDQMGIQDIQGAIFVFITENTFPSLYGVIHVFPQELPLFIRETKGGLYPVDAYYISKIIALAPGFVIEPFIFCTIAYWLIGLKAQFSAYVLTSAVAILVAQVSASCGCFFSAAFDNVSVAITCLVPFDYVLMITGGLFINIGTLPQALAWTKYLSWFLYGNEAISIVQWNNVTDIPCPTDPALPCIRNGEEVLASRSFKPFHINFDIFGLIILYCIFHVGAYICLLIKSRRK